MGKGKKGWDMFVYIAPCVQCDHSVFTNEKIQRDKRIEINIMLNRKEHNA